MFVYVLVILIILYIFFLYFLNCKEHFSRKLTFSSQASWGEVERSFLHKLTPDGKRHVKSFPMRPFPPNDSMETHFELEEVKKKRNNLSNERQKEIDNELYLHGILDLYSVTKEERSKIVTIIRNEIDPVIMYMKHKYNRARPYHLDPSIIPSISPPKHPSYPSGHSTQSFYIAYQLSKMRPDKHNEYMEIANSIAENREYAGVHYKSDSDYGKILGKYLSDNISIVHF